MVVSANEVKIKGVSLFDKLLKKYDELIITFRGKKKFVVMDIDRYNELREKELELAYKEAMEDYKNGDYHTDINKHLEEIKKVINV